MSTHRSKLGFPLAMLGVVLGYVMASASPRTLGSAHLATLLVQRIPYDAWCLVADAAGKAVSALGTTILGGASW